MLFLIKEVYLFYVLKLIFLYVKLVFDLLTIDYIYLQNVGIDS